MKYSFLLLTLMGCSPLASTPITYVCFNPMTIVAPAEIEIPAPNVEDEGTTLTVTTERGDRVTVPKSLCVAIRKAQ